LCNRVSPGPTRRAATSATAGSDYSAVADTLTFGPTETVQTVSVTVAGDVDAEGDETFALVPSNAAGALIADSAAVAPLSNDDTLPAVGVLAPDPSAAEGLSFDGGLLASWRATAAARWPRSRSRCRPPRPCR